jgi:prepilin-type processing-associated H-X9-DG protein/prepilin-type N-terminal cleavage/methylation domain-containing protein
MNGTASDKQCRTQGFSLIELVAVVAILTLVAALVLSALNDAAGKARQTQCLNNLGQHGIALTQFVNDYHCYPLAVENGGWMYGGSAATNPPASSPGNPVCWADELARYSQQFRLNTSRKPWQTEGLWHCPSAKPLSVPMFPEGVTFWDYGYNVYGVSRFGGPQGSLGLSRMFADYKSMDQRPTNYPVPIADGDRPVAEAEVTNPSDMMAIADGFSGLDPGTILDGQGWLCRRFTITNVVGGLLGDACSTRRSNQRHRGKADVVFCDGHVEATSLKMLFQENSAAPLSRWNRDHLPHRDEL